MRSNPVILFLVLFSVLALSGCQRPSQESPDTVAEDVDDGGTDAGPGDSPDCNIVDQVRDAMNTDPLFQEPYVDLDEWRDEPVRHRYVHGGFSGTDTRFSFYLPPEEKYEGRFFQYITPVPLSETLSQGATGEEDKIGFAIDSGAYFIETNGGGSAATGRPDTQVDPTIAGYRANAASAQYSRIVAMGMYGCQRPYGYAFGGSGGAYRTIGGIENTTGVWDGAVPFVPGSPMAAPNVFTVRMYALRVLEDKLPAIADAVDAGSDVDPFELLDDQERQALREVTRMGFPLEAWYIHDELDLHGFASLFSGVRAVDPAYFNEDFWNKPGYAGVNPSQSLQDALIEHRTVVTELVMAENAEQSGLKEAIQAGETRGLADDAFKALLHNSSATIPVAIKLENMPDKNTLGADVFIRTGEAAGETTEGERLLVTKEITGNYLLVGNASDALANLKVGDQVEINNRDVLASQTYHRHQVPEAGYPVYDIYRDENGEPLYPQRPVLLGPRFAASAAGSVPTMDYEGKIIVLSNLHDTEAYPWQGDWFVQRAKEQLGPEFNDRFRLWYTDHASHGDKSTQKAPTHLVSYLGVLQQALRDVSAWVEEGIEPASTTSYSIDNGQVRLPESVNDRGGIQPVVQLLANGEKRAEAGIGEPVDFTADVTAPEKTGKIVEVAWDFAGDGTFPEVTPLPEDAGESVTVRASRSFDEPGTYFVTLRAVSHRTGDPSTPFARIRNLDRVRVVVE